MIAWYTKSKMLLNITKFRCIGLRILPRKSIAFFIFMVLTGCNVSGDSYPAHQQGMEFFEANRDNLQRVADYFVRYPEIEKMSVCPPGGNWGVSSADADCEELADQDIRLALEQLNVGFVTRTNRGSILFDVGADTAAGRSWTVSFVYFPFENIDRNECNPNGPEASVGICDFEIANSWSLHYEWHPENLGVSN